jgi:MFS family permease
MSSSTDHNLSEPALRGQPAGRWRALALLATATFLAMTTWFSASAVIPQLRAEWHLTATQAALLTIAVQLGFVAGALFSATFNLADLVSPRRLIFLGAAGAALVNLALVWCEGVRGAVPLRFATGAWLALVYPSALKEMATWFSSSSSARNSAAADRPAQELAGWRAGRGTALGVMVGALTLGSALPHLLNAFGGAAWKTVIAATSALTLLGGLCALAARDGPFPFPRAVFDPRQVWLVFANRGVRLASFGYFGHMWELYAMWTWIGVFLLDYFSASGASAARQMAGVGAFAMIGVGAIGCAVAGVLGDRWGRTRTNALALLISGSCCLLIGWPGLPTPAVILIGLCWGFWVVADSAQFSTMVTETADQSYVGTAVTLQLAVGFTLTVATIWLVPVLRDAAGWYGAFAALAPGPAAGILAMLRLKSSPEAARIAGGRG